MLCKNEKCKIERKEMKIIYNYVQSNLKHLQIHYNSTYKHRNTHTKLYININLNININVNLNININYCINIRI